MSAAPVAPGLTFARERPTGVEAVALIRASGLNGPTEDPARMQRMMDEAQYVEIVRFRGELIGLVRVLTDGAYNACVVDLTVHPAHQGLGIGTRLMERALDADPQVKFVLHAHGELAGFYRRFGFQETVAMVRPRTQSS